VKADIFHAYRALLRQTKPSILINTNQVRVLSFFSPRILIQGANSMGILIRILYPGPYISTGSGSLKETGCRWEKTVMWIHKWFLCGSGSSFFFSMGIRKRCRSTCGSYPKLYTCWIIGKFLLYFYSQQSQFTMFFLTHKRQRGT